MRRTSYAIALGSNRRHGRYGAPAGVLRAAIDGLGGLGEVTAVSHIRPTPPFGPAGRSFANAAAILDSSLDPPALLARLKATERDFGRRPGLRWGTRVLDLDIILWSGGAWEEAGLIVPHRSFRQRLFVLQPLAEIAPGWRDPLTGLCVRHALARRLRRSPVDRAAPHT